MKTILVVDDDAIFRAVMKRHLERLGYAVTMAESGLRVNQQIAESRPVACLIDLMMEDKEGIETIGEIRRLPDRPKLIAVSSNPMYLDFALECGADAVLPKPVAPAELEAKLRDLAVSA